MKIKAKSTFYTAGYPSFQEGETYDINEADGAAFCERGLAEEVKVKKASKEKTEPLSSNNTQNE